MQHFGYEFKYDIRGVDSAAPSTPIPAWAAHLLPRIVALLNSKTALPCHASISAQPRDDQFGQRRSSDADVSPSANCGEDGVSCQEGDHHGTNNISTVAAAFGPPEQSHHLPAATCSTGPGSLPIGANGQARGSPKAVCSCCEENGEVHDSQLDQLTVNEYCAGVGLSRHIDTHSAFTGVPVSLTSPPFVPLPKV